MPFTLDDAIHFDKNDPLASYRDQFLIPTDDNGSPLVYLCGHSLGLQPKNASKRVQDELDKWAKHGVEGHFNGEFPWATYHESVTSATARLVGANSSEIVLMNSLSVNLHLMLASFYNPSGRRTKILIEGDAFSSDRYAVMSQIRWHGLDPQQELIQLPVSEKGVWTNEAIKSCIDEYKDELALVLWSGVHWLNGQWFDAKYIVECAHNVGARVGIDLAHSVGNVPIQLSSDAPDFAIWCSYKYLNSGPGGVGGAYIHSRYHSKDQASRLEGWWGNTIENRFAMLPSFQASNDASAWQISNEPILSMASYRSSIEIFDQVEAHLVRHKSVQMSRILYESLVSQPSIRVVSPVEVESRGCMTVFYSTTVPSKQLSASLREQGIVTDVRTWKNIDVVRVAFVPLYNTFQELHTFIVTLHQLLSHEGK